MENTNERGIKRMVVVISALLSALMMYATYVSTGMVSYLSGLATLFTMALFCYNYECLFRQDNKKAREAVCLRHDNAGDTYSEHRKAA